MVMEAWPPPTNATTTPHHAITSKPNAQVPIPPSNSGLQHREEGHGAFQNGMDCHDAVITIFTPTKKN